MRRIAAMCVLAALQACSGPAVVDQPRPSIIAVADWGGQPTTPSSEPQRITRITLHHQGETWRIGDDVPGYLRRLQQWSRDSRHWPDIPYHFVIAPDGRIYAARPLALAGDTNTEYDPKGHALVMLLGNFEKVEPTTEQLNSTVELMASLARTYGLGADSIATHRDFSAQTVCPGRNLYRYIESGWLVQAVDRRLRGLSVLTPRTRQARPTSPGFDVAAPARPECRHDHCHRPDPAAPRPGHAERGRGFLARAA